MKPSVARAWWRRSRTAAASAAISLCTLPAWAAGSAPPSRQVALGNAALATTVQGRLNLKYLSYCALDDHTVLVAEHEGTRYEFPGVVGLAPAWAETDLSATEQQWVSACMLALKNHAGAHVEVSLFLPSPPNATVKKAWQEPTRQYPVAEGRYFGNLFQAQPVSYVCSPTWTAEQRAFLEQRQRLCALPTERRSADGRPLTVCGMVHVGECSDAAFEQSGVRYQASILVHLPERIRNESGPQSPADGTPR